MNAIIYNSYGKPQVLKLRNIDKPKPKENEVLVKIHATSVTSGDVRLRSSDFPPLFWLPARLIFGLFRPKKKILGHEFSGEIEQVGSQITKFKIGDEVFGTTTFLKQGSYAEYVCVPQEWKHGVIDFKPKGLSHQESAVLPIGGMTALYLLEKADFQENQKVLIYGASGSVGSYAIQLAKYKKAEITAVCRSTNFDMVKALGADHCIDYRKKDYSKETEKYDIVFDAVGKTNKSKTKNSLKENGKFVTVNTMTKENIENLNRIKHLAEANHLKPFIDQTFALSDVSDAHRYVDTGRKRGNVSIQVINV